MYHVQQPRPTTVSQELQLIMSPDDLNLKGAPLPEHTLLGRKGEEYAARLMRKKGYKLLEQNFRLGKMEVDLIVGNRSEIVVVEVKTRAYSYADHIAPEDYVDEDKKRRMLAVGNAYMKMKDLTKNLRCDIIGLIMNPETFEVTECHHLIDAVKPRPRTVNRFTHAGKGFGTHIRKKKRL